MSNPLSPDSDLLDRYLANDCSAAERAMVEAWVASAPEHAIWMERMQRAATEPFEPVVLASPDEIWGRVMAEVDAQPGVSRQRFGWVLRAGAAMTMAAVVLVGAVTMLRHPSAPSPVQRYTTRAGERSTIHLASGSTMTLAPATSVSVTPQGVTVLGEAYFTIAPNPSRPFIVETRNARVQVLGTAFGVRQYPSERESRVTVADGKVTVQPSMSNRTVTPTVLSARMVGQVQDSMVTVRSEIAVEEYVGWMQGRLAFNDIPLRDVASDLSRAYGRDIRIEDSTLTAIPLTVKFDVTRQSLPQVLDIIVMLTNSHYIRAGNGFVVLPGGQPARVPTPARLNPQPEMQYGR